MLAIVDEIKGLYALLKKIKMEFFDFLKNTIFLASREEASYQNITSCIVLVTVASWSAEVLLPVRKKLDKQLRICLSQITLTDNSVTEHGFAFFFLWEFVV